MVLVQGSTAKSKTHTPGKGSHEGDTVLIDSEKGFSEVGHEVVWNNKVSARLSRRMRERKRRTRGSSVLQYLEHLRAQVLKRLVKTELGNVLQQFIHRHPQHMRLRPRYALSLGLANAPSAVADILSTSEAWPRATNYCQDLDWVQLPIHLNCTT